MSMLNVHLCFIYCVHGYHTASKIYQVLTYYFTKKKHFLTLFFILLQGFSWYIAYNNCTMITLFSVSLRLKILAVFFYTVEQKCQICAYLLRYYYIMQSSTYDIFRIYLKLLIHYICTLFGCLSIFFSIGLKGKFCNILLFLHICTKYSCIIVSTV